MKKQKDARVGTVVLAVFLLLFFMVGLTILRMWNVRSWVGEAGFRVLLVEGSLRASVLTIWPGAQEPVLMEIPEDVFISSVGGYGNLTTTGLLKLGEAEGVGERLLADSLSYSLGMRIHKTYSYDGEVFPVGKFKTGIIQEGITGQRSLIEAIEISGLVDKVTWSTIKRIELGTPAGVRQRTEVDGSVQNYFDSSLLMSFLEERMKTLWVEAADLQVAVVNTSNMPLMASGWSRYARLEGFDVVSVTDIPGQKETTDLVFSNPELRDSVEGKALASVYPFAEVVVGDTNQYRADAALLVGLNSWQWLNQRAAYLDSGR